VELSIIILSFNVRELLLDCLKSIFQNKTGRDKWQVIVVDNASTDGSLEAAKRAFPEIEALQTGKNLGFAKGNNFAVPHIKADTILFLNPDTVVVGDVIQKSLEFLKKDPEIGALTCRVELPDGSLDYSCQRGFPTPFNSLMYFSGLSRLFPKSKIFSGYSAGYCDTATTHEIDCGNGTFLMVPKKVGDKVGWWDEDYFWNGEDIEFFYCVKEAGYRAYFFAGGKIIHFKGSSSGLWKSAKSKVPKEISMATAKHAAEAMRIFFKKHFYQNYPPVFRDLILGAVTLLEKYRLLKITVGVKHE